MGKALHEDDGAGLPQPAFSVVDLAPDTDLDALPPPMTGEEYLQRVRLEASRCPGTVVMADAAAIETRTPKATAAAAAATSAPASAAVVAAVAALFGACWLVAPLFGACWLVAPLFGASLIGLPFRPWYPRAPRYMRVGEPRYEDAIVCENVTIRTPDNLPLIRALSFAVQRGESMLVMGTFQRVFCFF